MTYCTIHWIYNAKKITVSLNIYFILSLLSYGYLWRECNLHLLLTKIFMRFWRINKHYVYTESIGTISLIKHYVYTESIGTESLLRNIWLLQISPIVNWVTCFLWFLWYFNINPHPGHATGGLFEVLSSRSGRSHAESFYAHNRLLWPPYTAL